MSSICLLFVLLFGQTDPKPLPELRPFLAEFRKTLHPDDVLLSQYTYTAKYTHIQVDSDGHAKKTDVEVFQITRDRTGQVYRTMISRNGNPVRSAKPEKVRQRRRSRQDEEKILDDVFSGYDFQLVGREDFNGYPVVHLKFTPRPTYKPKTLSGKLLQNVAGEAWVNESDHALARVHAEMIDSFSIGFGLLAKLQKGSVIDGERQKINEEVWLPAKTEITARARVLLLKGINVHEIVEYSDYKKFSVDTKLTFPDEKDDK